MKVNEGVKEIVAKANQVMEAQTSQIVSYEQAQVDGQITTAKRFPRSIGGALEKAKGLATWDKDVAASCTYALPVRAGGKMITGPSVRLAEIMAVSWGNISAGSRPAQIDETSVTGLGFCYDLEQNVRFVFETRRRITDRNGNRYSEDMINQTVQAASAIAFRNAVFKVVPMAFTLKVQTEAQKTARGVEKGLEQRRKDALEKFKTEKGIDKQRILKAIGCRSEEDIGWQQIDMLLGLWAAIDTGESTVEEIFPEPTKDASNVKEGRSSFKNSKAARKEVEKPVEEETEEPSQEPEKTNDVEFDEF
jgi:hypothetical protein